MRVTQLIRAGISFPGLVQEGKSFRKEASQLEAKFMKDRMIVLRDVTREELKREIRNLFSNGQTLYYSDIAEQLEVDLKSVVDICRELQENKEIGVDNSVPTRTL